MRHFFITFPFLIGVSVAASVAARFVQPRSSDSLLQTDLSVPKHKNVERLRIDFQPEDHAPRPVTFADSTQAFYGKRDVASLRRLLKRSDSRAERWLCLYRLYPLTEDDALLDVPASLKNGTAREYALLAGLWGYQAAQRSFPGNLTAGRRSTNLLNAAKDRDSDDVFTLLIAAQSLLYRPTLFGGDNAEALHRLRALRRQVEQSPSRGISLVEVDQWIWYTLRKLDRYEDADTLRRRLLSHKPPLLYRDFLQSK